MAQNFKQSLNLGQIQSLRMTPQLQQAIKLLQMSRLELESAIHKELEENPVLDELGEEDLTQETKGPVESSKTSEMTGDLQSTSDSSDAAPQDVQDPTKHDEFEWESYLDNTPKLPSAPTGANDTEEIANYENVISSTGTLYDYLIWQLNLNGFNEEEYVIAAILIAYVDDDGYIKTPFEEIAEKEGTTVAELEEILPFVQEFDPPGIGARDLQECLLVQARYLQEDTQDMVHLITQHLKDLEKKNYEGIAKAMSKPLQEIIEMCKIINDMEPKPGRAYAVPDTQYITPDVFVYQVGEDYVVSLNEDGLPRLKVSNFYKNALKAEARGDSQTQEYIKDKLRSAVWLIKSIHQRQRTIYKVAEAIVKYQRDFFERGPGFIKPMILRDIANDVGIHESTVSRVTTNKYMHTPRGIFELKYFFNSGISTDDGDSLASESVKTRIKEMVSKEDVKNPLSDQKLVELLKKDGINIARRTVAKYRDMLGVLPSSKRKKFF